MTSGSTTDTSGSTVGAAGAGTSKTGFRYLNKEDYYEEERKALVQYSK
jgi:hypothetical protein